MAKQKTPRKKTAPTVGKLPANPQIAPNFRSVFSSTLDQKGRETKAIKRR